MPVRIGAQAMFRMRGGVAPRNPVPDASLQAFRHLVWRASELQSCHCSFVRSARYSSGSQPGLTLAVGTLFGALRSFSIAIARSFVLPGTAPARSQV